MRTYNPSRSCPKCGSRAVTTRYDATFNRVCRGCLHCGFVWYELPADASERPWGRRLAIRGIGHLGVPGIKPLTVRGLHQ